MLKKARTVLVKALFLFIALTGLPSCEDVETIQCDFTREGVDDLTAQQEKWEAMRPARYELDYQIGGQIVTKFKVIVEGAKILRIGQQRDFDAIGYKEIYAGEGELPDEINTVSDIFDRLDALNRQEERLIDILKVEWDEQYGYPNNVQIDPMSCRDNRDGTTTTADDDETSWKLRVVALTTPPIWQDEANGLTWQNEAVFFSSEWSAALDYCEELNLDSKCNWRLPTVEELSSLISGCDGTTVGEDCAPYCNDQRECGTEEACDCGLVPVRDGCYWSGDLQGKCGTYWSSSEHEASKRALAVNFKNGLIQPNKKDRRRLVRCVHD